MYDTMKRKWIVALCAAALAGCSKDPMEPVGPVAGTVPIELSAGTQSGVETKASVEGSKFPEMTPAFYLTATQGTGETAPTDWRSPYFSDKPVNSASDGTLSWPAGETQYYPANASQKLWFYAYSPQGTGIEAGTADAAPVVSFDITDGQQDIMAAQASEQENSDRLNGSVSLAFTHKLMKVRFAVKADASFTAGTKVTGITITGVPTTAKLDIGSGALTLSDEGNITAYAAAADTNHPDGTEITSEGAELENSCVMFGASSTFKVEVTAGGVVYPDVSVSLTGEGAGRAGMGHLVTLTFYRGNISATASIVEWGDGGSYDADVW